VEVKFNLNSLSLTTSYSVALSIKEAGNTHTHTHTRTCLKVELQPRTRVPARPIETVAGPRGAMRLKCAPSLREGPLTTTRERSVSSRFLSVTLVQ